MANPVEIAKSSITPLSEKAKFQDIFPTVIAAPKVNPIQTSKPTVASKVYGIGVNLLEAADKVYKMSQLALAKPVLEATNYVTALSLSKMAGGYDKALEFTKESSRELEQTIKKEGVFGVFKPRLDKSLAKHGTAGKVASWMTAAGADLLFNPFSLAGSVGGAALRSVKAAQIVNEGGVPIRAGKVVRHLNVIDLDASLLEKWGGDIAKSKLLSLNKSLQVADIAQGTKVRKLGTAGKEATELSGGRTDEFVKDLIGTLKAKGFDVYDGRMTRFFQRIVAPTAKVPESFGFARGELLAEMLNDVGLLKSKYASKLLPTFIAWNYKVAMERGDAILRITKDFNLVPTPSRQKLMNVFGDAVAASKGLGPDEFWLKFARFIDVQAEVERYSKGGLTLEVAYGNPMKSRQFKQLVDENAELAEKISDLGYTVVDVPANYKAVGTLATEKIGNTYTQVSEYLTKKQQSLLKVLVDSGEIPADWEKSFSRVPKPPLPVDVLVPKNALAEMISRFVPTIAADQRVIAARNYQEAVKRVSGLKNIKGEALDPGTVKEIFTDKTFGIAGIAERNMQTWNEKTQAASSWFTKTWQEWNQPEVRLMDLPHSEYQRVAQHFGINGNELAFAVKSAMAAKFGKDSLFGIQTVGGLARARFALVDQLAKLRVQIRWKINPVFRGSQTVENTVFGWLEKGFRKDDLPKEFMDLLTKEDDVNLAMRAMTGNVEEVVARMSGPDRKAILDNAPALIRNQVDQYLRWTPTAKFKTWGELKDEFAKVLPGDVDNFLAKKRKLGVELSRTEAISEMRPDLAPYVNLVSRAKDEAVHTIENTLMFSSVRTAAEKDFNYIFFPASYFLRVFRYTLRRSTLPIWEKGTLPMLRAANLAGATDISDDIRERYPNLSRLMDMTVPFSLYGDIGFGIEPFVRLVLANFGVKLPDVQWSQQDGLVVNMKEVGEPRSEYHAFAPPLNTINLQNIEAMLKQFRNPPKGWKPEGELKLPVPAWDVANINTLLMMHPNYKTPPLKTLLGIIDEKAELRKEAKEITRADREARSSLRSSIPSAKSRRQQAARDLQSQIGPRPPAAPKPLNINVPRN